MKITTWSYFFIPGGLTETNCFREILIFYQTLKMVVGQKLLNQEKTSFFGFSGFFRAELVKTKLPEYSDFFIPENGSGFPTSIGSRDQSFHQFDCFA